MFFLPLCLACNGRMNSEYPFGIINMQLFY